MPKYVIEREFPGSQDLTPEQLQGIAQTSNQVIDGMAGRAQWLESYVTEDKIFCVYIADDKDSVLEHAKAGGFPANHVREVHEIIDPTTANAA